MQKRTDLGLKRETPQGVKEWMW